MKKKKLIKKGKASINDVYGIWKDKDVSLEKIREGAWNKKKERPTTDTGANS